MQNKKAFTLVELIVSIVILAILGTIAVISLQGYSKTSRDSVRISDLSNMKTSLELFHIAAGKFPLTTDGYNVTYGGGDVWTQGVFGENTFKNVDRLDKIPRDPLIDKEYTYSVLNTRQEYQIAGIMETDPLSLNNTLFKDVYAATQSIPVMVTGNYNGETVNVDKGGTTCVVAMPSIITSSGTTLETIIPNNYLVYDNYKNLPSNYATTTKFELLGETNLVLVNELNMDLYCGDFEELEINSTARLEFIDNYQKAYTGTQVEVEGRIKEVLELSIDTNNPTPDIKIYTIELVEDLLTTTISDEQKEAAAECNTNYTRNGTICEADTRQTECLGSIAVNATETAGITYTQTWSGTEWLPTTTWGESQPTCDFDCNLNYTWNNGISTCEADGQIFTCASKPANTIWNTASSYSQTWSGTEWLPTDTATEYNEIGSTTTCNYICDTDFHTEDGGLTCISDIQSCTITNGTGTDTWNGISWDCTVTTCDTDYYNPGNNTCSPVGIGYYSNTTDTTRTSCTNYPDTASRNYTYTSDGNGTNSCTASYTQLCGTDLYETVNGTCSAVGTGYYSANLSNTRLACTNKPISYSIYTGDGNGINACPWSCNTGYSNVSNLCTANVRYTSARSACSVTCGGGTQTRTVQCKSTGGTVLPDSSCLTAKPATSIACNTQSCGGTRTLISTNDCGLTPDVAPYPTVGTSCVNIGQIVNQFIGLCGIPGDPKAPAKTNKIKCQ